MLYDGEQFDDDNSFFSSVTGTKSYIPSSAAWDKHLWRDHKETPETQANVIELRSDGAHEVHPDVTGEDVISTIKRISTQPSQSPRIILLENLTPQVFKALQEQFDLNDLFYRQHVCNDRPSSFPRHFKRGVGRLFGRIDFHFLHRTPHLLFRLFSGGKCKCDEEMFSSLCKSPAGYWQQIWRNLRGLSRLMDQYAVGQHRQYRHQGYSIPRQLNLFPFNQKSDVIWGLRYDAGTSYWYSRSSISMYRMSKDADCATGT